MMMQSSLIPTSTSLAAAARGPESKFQSIRPVKGSSETPLHKNPYQASDKRSDAAAKFSVHALSLREPRRDQSSPEDMSTEKIESAPFFSNTITDNFTATQNLTTLMSSRAPEIASVTSVVDSETERSRKLEELALMRQGSWVGNGRVYRQTLVIRSYEAAFDGVTSMASLISIFQEVGLNHFSLMGITGEGIGASRGMNANRLIWVITRMHVEVERMPHWGEVVDVDTWIAASGKMRVNRDWYVREKSTGLIIARGSSTMVMVNIDTKKVSRIPNDVKTEIEPSFIDRSAFDSEEGVRIDKFDETAAQSVSSNIYPRRHDLDMNLHVNNIKYVDWVIQTMPEEFFETHEVYSFTLEYRRECHRNYTVQSLAKLDNVLANDHPIFSPRSSNGNKSSTSKDDHQPEPSSNLNASFPKLDQNCDLQFTHLIRTQSDGKELARGRTLWRPKSSRLKSYL